ncbi:MAG: cbb3-type cytochrome c oxidase subunit I [Anaerolineae bacterium]|nr:cbb3-type cytochrome c oxidase subunit I [Anaerolineae bacterium]
MFFLGVFTAGWSSILGALNVIATVVRMRAKGMTAMRMPILVWASVATSIIALTATQLIGLSFQLVMFQRFVVWAHHMFTSGMNEYLRVPFMYSTMLVAVPTGVKFFSWVATMWGGKIETPTPMLFVLGSIVVFLLGGVTGPPNAMVALDLHLHDTYWVVGHFHDTIFGGFVFPFLPPFIIGSQSDRQKMNEFWGKVHFWLMTPRSFALTLGMMFIGLRGMRRRIVDYDPPSVRWRAIVPDRLRLPHRHLDLDLLHQFLPKHQAWRAGHRKCVEFSLARMAGSLADAAPQL